MNMQFKIEPTIFEKFPEVVIGIVAAKGVNNEGVDSEIIDLLRSQEQRIKQEFSLETLGQVPQILAWRVAYSAFGAKPKDYRCSVENLYRMILEGIELRHINKVVDLYNYISLKHLAPVGGDDIDKVEGDIVLKLASGAEIFKPLNSQEIKSPHPGEVVYCDSREVLCRRWNWRECDKTKLTEQTENIALVVEGLPPINKEKVGEIIEELAGLLKTYCAGETKTYLLDTNNPEITI
jgi:lysyl-tRNA synthetase class 2